MARPKTKAATYVPLMLRVPQDIAEELRRLATASHRAINTQAILVLGEALGVEIDDPVAAERFRRPDPIATPD